MIFAGEQKKCFGHPFVLQLPQYVKENELVSEVQNHIFPLIPNVEWDEKQIFEKNPFKLTVVDSRGTNCINCQWLSSCRGCDVSKFKSEDEMKDYIDISEIRTIGIDWNYEFLMKYVNPQLFCSLKVHPSVVFHRQPKVTDLDFCLKHFVEPEHLEFKCEKCKVNRPFTKKLGLWNSPEVLIVQLKRLLPDGTKITTDVDFPFELSLSDFVEDPDYKNDEYELYAILNHLGTVATVGHYISYVRLGESKKWYCFDDEKVLEIDENSLKTPGAYLLFYQKVHKKNDQINSVATTYFSCLPKTLSKEEIVEYENFFGSDKQKQLKQRVKELKSSNLNPSDCTLL